MAKSLGVSLLTDTEIQGLAVVYGVERKPEDSNEEILKRIRAAAQNCHRKCSLCAAIIEATKNNAH